MSWQLTDFSNLATDVSGGNRKTLQSEYLPSGKYPIIDQGQTFIAGYSDDASRLCRTPDPVVIFGDHTTCFKFVDFRFCMGADGTKVLAPKEGVDAKYLYYALQTIHIPGAGYSRHFKYLKAGKLPLPPLPEQQCIAAILDQADAMRRLRRQSLSRLSDLGQAIFFEMFGGVRDNAKGFSLHPLGEIADIRLGKMLDRGKPKGHMMRAYLRNANVRWFDFDLSEVFEMEIADKEVSRFAVQNGDLLICEGGEPGRSAVWRGGDGELFYQKALHRARVDRAKVLPDFLNYWFFVASREGMLADSVTVSTISHLTGEKIKKLKIALPPIEQQTLFVDRLQSVEERRAAAMKSSEKIEELFTSLQHRAFRGEL